MTLGEVIPRLDILLDSVGSILSPTSISQNHRPIKQKKKEFALKLQKLIAEEINKLLGVGFI